MEASGTEALRNSATNWSLAGDKKLLQLLQEIHEKVVTRCKETNTLLEQMTTSLDEASIDVENVNNKFMSLSNSQFVESRVYGDDADVTTDPVPQKEEPKPPDSPLTKIKQSLQVLERMHDTVEIYDDTDSESDSDNCVSSTVLKPKDLYSHRPLPYIIGSHNWRTKWHVGLIHESSDSESDSDVEKHLSKPEYSDTESEKAETRERSRTLSSSSESAQAPLTVPPRIPSVPTLQSPADIASELARRLGSVGQRPTLNEEFEPPKMSTGKIYRPEQPATATIFSDEPPPLDETLSDNDNYEDEEEDDIFAELHINRSKETAREEQRQAATSQPVAKQKSTLFEDDSEPELFAPKPQKPQIPIPTDQSKQNETDNDNTVKKPIGGISLFGNNKGAESIGAAILKRNQRKSSTSDEDSDNQVANQKAVTGTETNKTVEENDVKTKEKDIFENLFSKPQNETTAVQKKKPKPEIVKQEVKKKVDLFSDDLFDDIDDIFSSNVVKSAPKSNVHKPKSLFDDDDLFADDSVSKPVKVDCQDNETKKISLFDSEDELFSEKPKDSSKDPEKVGNIANTVKKRGLFDSDDEVSENQDKLSTNYEVLTKNTETKHPNISVVKENKISIFDESSDDDNIFDKVVTKPIRETTIISDHTHISKGNEQNFIKSNKKIDTVFNTNNETTIHNNNDQTKIITSEKTDNDTFNNNSNDQIIKNQVTNIKKGSNNKSKKEAFQSPSLFDDDEDDVDNLFFKGSSRNILNNVDSSKENTIPSIYETKTFSMQNDDKNMDIDSPTVSKDVKSTSKVLVEETPYKANKEKTKQTVNVDDSWLEDDPLPESNDLDKNQLFKSIEEHKSNETKCVFSANDTKSQNQQINTQIIDDLSTKVNEKLEVKEHTQNDFKNISPTQRSSELPHEELMDQEKPLGKCREDIENNVNFKENNETKEILSSVMTSKPESKSDVFNKLFTDEPPAFEKPKEPKKSKNVNALFDDDSDDEALFFKKSDAPLLDEKSELFSTSTSKKNLFGIFQDEPPDLNVDFTQKEDLTQKDQITKNYINNKFVDIEENYSLSKTSQNLNQGEQKIDNSKRESEIIDKVTDTKKAVGRIKTNLNINVNTLLPGGSPNKAMKIKENTETEQSLHTSTEELDSISISQNKSDEQRSHIMTRSVSFEDSPDTKVLDNKFSKERPRIQVRRRPSTRKARHEAVRKSVIDMNDDSTDNSSSIDDYSIPISKEVVEVVSAEIDRKEVDHIKTNMIDAGVHSKESASQVDNIITKGVEQQLSESVECNLSKNVKSKVVYILNDEDIFTNTASNTYESDNTKINKSIDIPEDLLNSELDSISDITKDTVDFKDSENLFKTSTTKIKDDYTLKDPSKLEPNTVGYKPLKDQPKKPILNIVDDDDDFLFKGVTNADLPPKVDTKDIKPVKSKKDKKSLFDDLSDDEYDLFKPKTTKVAKPKTVFGSDSDDEIFVNQKKGTVDKSLMVEKRERIEVKRSLFSDDDDDDVLFGAKKSSVDTKAHSSSSNVKETTESKRSKLALEDPLSMADEDF